MNVQVRSVLRHEYLLFPTRHQGGIYLFWKRPKSLKARRKYCNHRLDLQAGHRFLEEVLVSWITSRQRDLVDRGVQDLGIFWRLQKLSFEIRLQRSIHSLPIILILCIVHHKPIWREEKSYREGKFRKVPWLACRLRSLKWLDGMEIQPHEWLTSPASILPSTRPPRAETLEFKISSRISKS